MRTHLLIETGRASRLAACDSDFANGEHGSESLDDVDCGPCHFLFPATRPLAVWADGFGVWHVRIPVLNPSPEQVARVALRDELEPREANLDPAVWQNPERVFDLDTPATIVYREGTPS